MKVCLVNPPFLFSAKEEIAYSHCLGLRGLSSWLKSKGHEVVFIDALRIGFSRVNRYGNGFMAGLSTAETVSLLPPDPDLIGVSVPFSQMAPIGHELIGRLKDRYPGIPVIMGGTYPSTQPSLALTSGADFIIKGEGEIALLDIVEGKSAESISGVFGRQDAGRDKFPPAPLVEDLDSLPYADYDIPGMDSYFRLSPRARRSRSMSLITSRGCPYSCYFCSVHPVYGHCWRARSPEHVLGEVEYAVKRYRIRTLEIEDDKFTLIKDRAARILEGIIRLNEQGANLGWHVPNGVRVDTLDQPLIELIKRSNCRVVSIGLEHGDAGMLSLMNKPTDLDKTSAVVEQLVKSGIPRIILFVIVGYPGETRQRFASSLKYLEGLRRLGGKIGVSVHIAQAYPGTELQRQCRDNGLVTGSAAIRSGRGFPADIGR